MNLYRWIFLCTLLIALSTTAQCEKINMFTHFTLQNDSDTINHHAYSKVLKH